MLRPNISSHLRNAGIKHFTQSRFGPLSRQRFSPRTNAIQVRPYASYRRFNNSGSSPNVYEYYLSLLTSRKAMYIGGGLLGFYLLNLHEAPYTHRLRFISIPFWIETKIGDYSYRQIMSQYGSMILPHSNPLYGRISTIMNKLLATAIANDEDETQRKHLKQLHWEINIIQNDTLPPNAFILPNGKIFVFSSILPICENDDGLATVLSHELSHQLAQHSSEQLSSQPFYMFLSAVLYSMTGVSWFNDLLINGLFTMPASREMETEADHIGCEILAKSCFNPDESVKFWERMGREEQKLTRQMGGNTSNSLFGQWFSTHPATTKRIHDIEEWLPKLRELREGSGCYEYGRFHDFSANYFKRQ